MVLKDTSASITSSFRNKNILSISQFSPESFEVLFKLTNQMMKATHAGKTPQSLNGRVASLLFFEPSTRTYGSFSSAIQRLGGGVVTVQGAESTSEVKGETFEDTIRIFASYSDLLILRHPLVGASERAAAVAGIPVINAGDGIGEHPTQTCADLYTIHHHKKRLDSLEVAVVGDLLNGRTVHSLLRALSLYKKNTVYMLAPQGLELEDDLVEELRTNGLDLIAIHDVSELPPSADVWYWTRVQKERFVDKHHYEKVKDQYILTPELASRASSDTLFMHPLPRVGEVEEELDTDKRAVYFETVQFGLYVRMALSALIVDA